MPESLRILMLEDNPADAELVQFELEEAGFTFTAKVVMTEKDFVQELKECSFDLILSDYDLPNFNGALALARVKKGCPETPFILVTGAVSEDRAIEILTQGAKDYVLKTRLQQRLVPAVRRALAEAEEHRARKQAEADLREANRTLEEKVKARTLELEITNRQLQALFDYSAASLVLFDAKRPYTVIAHNKYYQELWDEPFRTNGMVGKNLLDYVPAVEQSGVMAVYDEVVQTGKARNLLSFPYDGMPRGKTWWNWHLSPITRDGKVIALAHMGIEVTREVLAREESEKRAKDAEEGKDTLNALMACIPEGITIARAPDVVTTMLSKYGSDMLLRGWETGPNLSMEDWLARVEHYLADGLTPAGTEDLPLWRAVKYGERVEGKELKLRRPTGEWLPVLCNAAPIRDKEGNITGGIVAWRDITARKLAEEALRQSEIQARQHLEEIQSIYDLTPIGLCVLDRDLRYVRINRRLAELNGLPAADHIGKTVREILPDLASMAEEVADRIFKTGHPVLDMEFSSSTSSQPGMERTFIMHWLPLKDADGNIFGISFVSEEITERKLAVERLNKSEAKYRLLFENMAEGFALYELLYDKEGKPADWRILEVNGAYTLHTGITAEKLVGRRISNVFPEAIPEYLPWFAKVVATQTPSTFETFASATGRYNRVATFPAGGHRFASIIADITESKKAEAALRASEERFRSYFELGLLGMAITSPAKRFIEVNEKICEILGYERKDLLQKTWEELTHPDDLAGDLAQFNRVMAGEMDGYSLDKRWIRKDGQIIHAVISVKCVRGTDQSVDYFITLVQDITDRRTAEEALKKCTDDLKNADREQESFQK